MEDRHDFETESTTRKMTIQWIAAPKLTEIVEVENETWQGAKFGVC